MELSIMSFVDEEEGIDLVIYILWKILFFEYFNAFFLVSFFTENKID